MINDLVVGLIVFSRSTRGLHNIEDLEVLYITESAFSTTVGELLLPYLCTLNARVKDPFSLRVNSTTDCCRQLSTVEFSRIQRLIVNDRRI